MSVARAERSVEYFLGLDSELSADEDELLALYKALPENLRVGPGDAPGLRPSRDEPLALAQFRQLLGQQAQGLRDGPQQGPVGGAEARAFLRAHGALSMRRSHIRTFVLL